MDASSIIKNLVPITLFNKGKASQLFSKVKTGLPLVVIKNNSPVAVVISPEEYLLFRELSMICKKSVHAHDYSNFQGRINTLLAKIDLYDEE